MSLDHFGSLAGKTILYTGAAGGLGLQATIAMLKTGAKVVAVDNNATKIAALREAAAGLDGLEAAFRPLVKKIPHDVEPALIFRAAAEEQQ